MVTLSKTGNRKLDEQHSVMQNCLSELAGLLNGVCDLTTLLGSLETLYSYAEWHFTFEERWLERTKYPHRGDHIAEHQAIIGQLNSLRRMLGAGNKDAVRLISIISHWIVDHVNNEDSRSAKYLGNCQVSTMPHEYSLAAELSQH